MQYYWRPLLAIILILVILGVGFAYSFNTYDKLSLILRDNLDENWRSEYDLLVSPNTENKTTSNSEAGLNLLRRSDIGNNYGGISLEQYEQIKQLEGVEIAAPISFIGYIKSDDMHINYKLEKEGYYYRESKKSFFDGQIYRELETEEVDIFQYNKSTTMEWDYYQKFYKIGGWYTQNHRQVYIPARSEFVWSLIAVDPEQENRLVGLKDALVEGEYFHDNNELLLSKKTTLIPIILQNKSYDAKANTSLYKIEVDEDLSADDIIERGGREYLGQLPRKPVLEIEYNPYEEEYIYYNGELKLVDNQLRKAVEDGAALGFSTFTSMYELGSIQHQWMGEFDENPLFKALPINNDGEQILYRTFTRVPFKKQFGFDHYGRFDSSRVVSKAASSDHPKAPDFYNPEKVYITHGLTGNVLQQRVEYKSSPNKTDYSTGGVDAITTLKAAEFFLGDHPISAIRVVVQGVEERSKESINKVENIAKQIQEITGLSVDVMLGAADRKVQVLLDEYKGIPGYGYLLEGWSESGSSFVIENRVNTTNLLLGAYVLFLGIIGSVLVFRKYSDVRRKDAIIQYTFGWSIKKIAYFYIIEFLVILLIVILVMFVLKITIGSSWTINSFLLSLVGVFCLSILSFLFFYLGPILKKIGMQSLLKTGGQRITPVFISSPMQSLWTYVWYDIVRFPLRSLTKFLIVFLTIIYSFLFLITKTKSTAFLILTFLGESIDIGLNADQWVLFAIGLTIAISSLSVIYTNQMEKRIQEIQLYKAWGWNTNRWLTLFVLEEVSISAAALISGIAVGYLVLILNTTQYTLQYSSVIVFVLSTIFITVLLFLITYITHHNQNRLKEFN